MGHECKDILRIPKPSSILSFPRTRIVFSLFTISFSLGYKATTEQCLFDIVTSEVSVNL